MKNLIAATFIVLISGQSYGQDLDKKYRSSQEDTYYNAASDFQFKPTDKEKITSFTLPHISLSYLQDFTPFKSVYDWSPEKKAVFEDMPDDLSEMPTAGTSGVRITDIVKKGELNGNQAIIFTDNTYDHFTDSGSGIWVALMDKNSGKWRKFYTGLSEYEPVFLKWDSKLPLFKDGNNLQIEAAFIRKITPEIHPATSPEYELVKDGLALTFDLNKLALDTDNDQLTDVVEAKMALDPKQKDTDGDNVPDNLDPNPRFNSPKTEWTYVYEAILADLDSPSFNGFKVPFKPRGKSKNLLLPNAAETFLIVSDSKDWQSVETGNKRLIVLSGEDYKKHKEIYSSTLPQIEVSPLFKVDKMKDTYKLHISASSYSGLIYLISKKRTYWEIKVISAWAT